MAILSDKEYRDHLFDMVGAADISDLYGACMLKYMKYRTHSYTDALEIYPGKINRFDKIIPTTSDSITRKKAIDNIGLVSQLRNDDVIK